MNWKNTLGYGALIWAVVFVVVSALVGFNVYDNFIAKGIVVILIGIFAYWLAARLHFADWGKALMLGISWIIVGMILDFLISARFTGSSLFYSKAYWAGYVLLLIGALAGSMWGKKAASAMPL